MSQKLRHLQCPTTILCFVLLLGFATMWIRSHHREECITYNWHSDDQTNEWRFRVRSGRGQFMLAFFNWTPDYYLSPFSKVSSERGFSFDSWSLDQAAGEFWSKWAFNETWSGNRNIGVIIPFWLPMLVLLVFLAAWMIRHRHATHLSETLPGRQ